MHAVHGAMTIRREREKREKRRQSRIERSNSKSPRNSDVSNLEKGEAGQRDLPDPPKPPKPESSLTAFHLGVVFILLGFLMVFSAMITNSMVEGDWSHLLGVGVTFIMVGLIMVMVNRIITAREEEELAKYVTTRLARTRSGYHIGRDIDNQDRLLQTKPPQRSASARLAPKSATGSNHINSKSASMRRSNSARRKNSSVPPESSRTPPRSSSNHSHLAVKNSASLPEHGQHGGPGGSASGPGSRGPASGVGQKDAGSSASDTIPNAEVMVTETETLLPKKDNKPALIVTKETSMKRTSSTRRSRQISLSST